MENEEIRSTLTFTYPDGTPFPSVIGTAANTTYIPPGGWLGSLPSPASADFSKGVVCLPISDADVERIADVVLRKLAEKEQ